VALDQVRGVLLDIDGVLVTSWHALDGAVETIAWLRDQAIPFRLITNTTTHTQADLAVTLGEAGFDVGSAEIVTAVVATASYLRTNHPGAAVFVLSDGDGSGDLEGVELVEDASEADVIVLGGACDDFSYGTINRIFRRLSAGAALVGMHRNMYWRTAGGLELDAGAYIAGLEAATGVTAAICGKPARSYFEAALEPLGVPAEQVLMVGDDIENDVLGAQAIGLVGALVRTGKFLPADLDHGLPGHVMDSVADLPVLLRG
jgi:HAD superfamily hydrolase (TIGR01458 family)